MITDSILPLLPTKTPKLLKLIIEDSIDGQWYSTKHTRKRMSIKLESSMVTISRCIQDLSEAKIIVVQRRGVYRLNEKYVTW